MKSFEWLTPPEIICSLGSFDLDPCSPINRPWATAKHHYTKIENGLRQKWFGRVWMNPPYGNFLKLWIAKLAGHDNGIALIPARTGSSWFHQYVFAQATSVFFFSGRLRFYHVSGVVSKNNADHDSMLIAYDENNTEAISDSGLKGKHVPVNSVPFIVVGISATWRSVVRIALARTNGETDLKTVYEIVELIAPDKVSGNRHHKAKIRQQLQYHFKRVQKGRYSL